MQHSHVFLRFPGGRAKALSFTFDDGTVEDRWLADRFGELGLRGTFNLNSGLFPAPGTDLSKLNIDIYPVRDIQHRMTAQEAAEALDRPYVEIASHGSLHADPTLLDTPSLLWELMSDRQTLEKLFSRPVTGYAYPQGAFNDRVTEAAQSCGFEYARTAFMSHSFGLPDDLMRLAPTCSYGEPAPGNPSVTELAERFLSFVPTTGMYYGTTMSQFFNIFGHTYEMNVCAGLKDRLDTLLGTLSGRDDVWYATNLEVVRYVKAFNSLVWSADRSSVYNPGAQRIWFYCADGTASVAPGETISL